MALHVELGPGDTLRVGTGTLIRMERKAGRRARLAIDSKDDIAHYPAGSPIPDLVRRRIVGNRDARANTGAPAPALVLKQPRR